MPNDIPYFEGLQKLKIALDKFSNDPSAISEVTFFLQDKDIRREFFDSILDKPNLITSLYEAGLFDNPPKSLIVDGVTKYPYWPESRCLARMAKIAPSVVAEILSELETDNILVIEDMIKAALDMPSKDAAILAPKIISAIQKGTLFAHSTVEISKLCIMLAEGGEVSAAMNLAEALFTPKFDEGKEQPSRIDTYWYKEGLSKVIPSLASVKPKELVSKLCDWLNISVNAKKHTDAVSGLDGSLFWRPAVEEHGQNPDYEFAGIMVGFVRQSFEIAIQKGGMSLNEALNTLDGYPYLIFRRIRIHLVNEFAEQYPELARQIMMDKEMFNDHKFKHEYAMLVGKRLNLLTPEERSTWFGWVDGGPDMSGYDEDIRRTLNRDATDEDRRNRKNHWKFEKFHIVKNYLGDEQRAIYETMLKEQGIPEMADLNYYVSTKWGNESPMTVDDLQKTTFEQALEKVLSWKPDERGRFMGPDIEGLAETFGKYIAANPGEFSEKAAALAGRPAIYVRTFIGQIAEAIKSRKEINVNEVLKLCHWVLERPVDEPAMPAKGNGKFVDKDWRGARDAISELIQQICLAKVDEKTDTPKYSLDELREPIRQALSKLCKEADAESYIVHDISKDEPSLQDYFTMGLNSAMGKAVEAVLEYARWVANHLKKEEGKRTVIPGGFEAMPEVREMLEWQIKKGNRSVTALSVIGAQIGLIYWIDRDWLSNNSERLFALEDESESKASGWAAWNAFLSWNGPNIEYYKLFKKQFAYAVRQSATVTPDEKSYENPMYRLGEHLMIFYGRGQLGLDDDEGILRRFLTDSHPNIRRHAIGFVGNSLEGEERVPDDIVNRFLGLWEAYWEGSGITDAEEKPDALLFGTWFASGKFPEQWALEQLVKFVQVTQTVEPENAVIEQLTKVSPEKISSAVRILDQMIRGDKEGWRTYGWRDSIKQILQMAMKAEGEPRKQAEKLIDFLGRRGYVEFGELLKL